MHPVSQGSTCRRSSRGSSHEEVAAMNRTTKTLRMMAVAALVGAVIGGFGRKTGLLEFTKTLSLTPGMRASIGLWFVFSVYWSIAAKDQAPTRSGESTLSRQAHVI